ncbi:MAG: GNAT family N-acetyltransferase [Oscillospiraceae bacterium]|nr:GNAT family N-acetyltransferase [Oscillospiraceae bacterium]
MKLNIRHYRDLTTDELYEILRARCAVFVVEQNCPYQDLDGLDQRSVHVFYTREDGSVAGCLRLYTLDGEHGTVHLGRVVTTDRGTGLGRKMLHEGVLQARAMLPGCEIVIHAQCYAIGFYAKEGFRVTSEEFMEDDIPHVEMRLSAD